MENLEADSPRAEKQKTLLHSAFGLKPLGNGPQDPGSPPLTGRYRFTRVFIVRRIVNPLAASQPLADFKE